MYIGKIRISGYHSLKSVAIKFHPGLNVLVGKNNAGKTNIIRAIDCIFGEKWPTYQDVEDKCFYHDRAGNYADGIEILAQLSGTGINAGVIGNPDKKIKTISFQEDPDFGNFSVWLSNAITRQEEKPWPDHEEIINRLERAAFIIIFLLVPRQSQRANREYGILFKYDGWWHLCPMISSDLRDALLTTAIIPAFRDPALQLKVTQYSWYGKLLRQIYNTRSAAQAEGIKLAQSSQAEILETIFQDTTSELRRKLSRTIFHHKISFQPGINTSDDEYKQITMFIDDGIEAPFNEKGSGIQSALIIGLFSYYCQQFHKGSSLLLVEEPEIYLHPQARRALESQLRQFVIDGMLDNENGSESCHQVIISTHSPEFLRSVPISNVALIQKNPGCTETRVTQIDKGNPRSSQIIETKNAEMFFADFVILVEGGEEYILPPLADIVIGGGETRCLDARNISIARVNGKGQFKDYVDLLDELNIPWAILTDLDFLHDGIEHFREYLTSESRDALSIIGQAWKDLSGTRIPRGKAIKEKIFSDDVRDWKDLYQRVDQVISNFSPGVPLEERPCLEIQSLWDRLKDKIQSKIDFQELINDCGFEINSVLNNLKEKNIFVLPFGELENHLPEKALESLHDVGKDRCALAFGCALSNAKSNQWIDEWLDSPQAAPLIEMLNSISSFLNLSDENQVNENEENYYVEQIA